MKYLCIDANNGDVLDIDPGFPPQPVPLIGTQFVDLSGPGLDDNDEIHLDMTCTWTIEADPNHDIYGFITHHDLHFPPGANCDSHTESTEIFNDENGASEKLCGNSLTFNEQYIEVHADKATIKLTVGSQTFSRSHNIILWQEPAVLKKRSADVDPTVGSKRRLPKKLTVSEEKDQQRNHFGANHFFPVQESEIIETAKFFAFANNKRKLCTDCDRRPFVEDYCICQNFLQDPCEIKPTEAPSQQSEEGDTLVEEQSSRRRRRRRQISQLKSSRRA